MAYIIISVIKPKDFWRSQTVTSAKHIKW